MKEEKMEKNFRKIEGVRNADTHFLTPIRLAETLNNLEN
jgi:hypothetical protein